MSEHSANAVFGRKNAGWFHSKTKVVNTFPEIPDPMRTKVYLKIGIFLANLLKNGDFQVKSLKNLRLLRKPCYVLLQSLPSLPVLLCFAACKLGPFGLQVCSSAEGSDLAFHVSHFTKVKWIIPGTYFRINQLDLAQNSEK